MIKKEFIRSKECAGCGASIAAHLKYCPYCEYEQSDFDLLPPEVYKELFEKIDVIENKLAVYSFSRKSDFYSWLAAFRELFFPLMLASLLWFIYNNWIFTAIFFVAASVVAYIRIKSSSECYISCDILEKRKWKYFLKPELKRYLKKQNLSMSAYYEVLLNSLQEKQYFEESDLCITLDDLET